jgi:hypothetical protein
MIATVPNITLFRNLISTVHHEYRLGHIYRCVERGEEEERKKERKKR